MRTLAESFGSWVRVVAILPVIVLETVLDAAPIFGAELMMFLRTMKWIVHEKARLIWRRQAHR
jgi:hypothetical protein